MKHEDETPAVAPPFERGVGRLEPERDQDGAPTLACRSGPEHGQRCRECGNWVRDDMTEHWFFGFKAGCAK